MIFVIFYGDKNHGMPFKSIVISKPKQIKVLIEPILQHEIKCYQA